MYRIKGSEKIFGLNFQSALSDKDRARAKLLYGVSSVSGIEDRHQFISDFNKGYTCIF